jgi:hypothetical protein
MMAPDAHLMAMVLTTVMVVPILVPHVILTHLTLVMRVIGWIGVGGCTANERKCYCERQ